MRVSREPVGRLWWAMVAAANLSDRPTETKSGHRAVSDQAADTEKRRPA